MPGGYKCEDDHATATVPPSRLPSDTTQNTTAAHCALNITELLEQVLLHLPMREVLLSK